MQEFNAISGPSLGWLDVQHGTASISQEQKRRRGQHRTPFRIQHHFKNT